MTELIHDRRSWERDIRNRLNAGRYVACDREWRPAPYGGCGCSVCEFVRAALAATPEEK